MRSVMPEDFAHTSIQSKIGGKQDYVNEVKAAVQGNSVVVVGMKQNPFVRKARKVLDENHIAYEYLEYGSYLSMWQERLAIKMWSGFATFPQVFVNGILIGGADSINILLDSGELADMIEMNKGPELD